MTPKQLQTVRRLHHVHAWKRPSEGVSIAAGDLAELINALWAAELRADQAEAKLPDESIITAEVRIAELLDSNGLNALKTETERSVDRVPRRQLTFANAPPPP